MTFEEEDNQIIHEIVLEVNDKEIPCYDYVISLSESDKFIKDTLKIFYKKDKEGRDTKEIENKIFAVREQETWWSLPLYEIIESSIEFFDYKKYNYFSRTERRVILARKINQLYNIPSELKTLRKTFKYIMDNFNIPYPDFFKKYNDKIETIINKNPK